MTQLGIVKRNIIRADKAAVEKLSRFGVATLCAPTTDCPPCESCADQP